MTYACTPVSRYIYSNKHGALLYILCLIILLTEQPDCSVTLEKVSMAQMETYQEYKTKIPKATDKLTRYKNHIGFIKT